MSTAKHPRSDGARESYSYSNDGLCRLISQTRSNGTDSFAYAYNYDTKGRRQKLTYPAGFAINYTYTAYDEVLELRKSDGSLIWKLNETNPANGQMQKATYGNGQQTSYSYNSEDRLTRIYVPGIIDFNYQFNNKQQLDWREEKYYLTDSVKWMGFKEKFGYDAVNRLDTVTGGASGLTMTYSGDHLASKSDAGTYTYKDGNHQIDELTAIAGYNPPQHNLAYTAEGKVDSITEITDTVTVKLLTFKYGINNDRFRMEYKVNDTIKYTRYYFDEYEKEVKADGTIRQMNYIYANGALVAIYTKANNTGNMHYVYTDYLGSLRCITDSLGKTEQMLSFDAWGSRRDPITGMKDSTIVGKLLFARGYTGHEHLDEVGLINMNGRVYDPRLGIFISPDNFVQAPEFSQNFNRYSYCLNNPLMYTDPTGEIFVLDDIILAAAIGAAVNLTVQSGNINSGGDFFKALGVGASAGALGTVASQAVSSSLYFSGFIGGSLSGASGGAVSGLIQGAGNTWMNGGNFEESLKNGLGSGISGLLTGGILGGLITGISDYRAGYNFWEGSKIDPFIIGTNKEVPIWEGYNSSPEAAFNDEILQLKINDEFRVKKGHFNIRKITTTTHNGYAVTAQGDFIDLGNRDIVGGYLRHFRTGYNDLHISPLTMSSDNITFRAVVGHELVHAYHRWAIPNFVSKYSEIVAYKYTMNTYNQAGQFKRAWNFMQIAGSRGYTGNYPKNYEIPLFVGF